MYAVVTNHVNWHMENLWSDRESTGNLKMKFEWMPCLALQYNVLESLDLQFFLFVWVYDIRPGWQLAINYAQMSVSKVKNRGPFRPQVNEMNEKMSFKMV